MPLQIFNPPPIRILRGRYDTTGPTILQGTGFTLTKIGTGTVKITFTSPFPTVPTVVGTLDNSIGASGLAVVLATAPATTDVTLTRSAAGGPADGAVCFIVIQT